MPSSFLALSSNDGGSAAILNYSGGTVDTIGTPGGTGQAFSPIALMSNNIIYYNGMIVYAANNGIYTSITDGKTAVLRYTFGTSGQRYGPFVCGRYLCVVSRHSTFVMSVATSTDGISWGLFTFALGSSEEHGSIISYKNKIYMVGGANSVYIIDPHTTAVSNQIIAGINSFGSSVVYNDNVYGLGIVTSTSIRLINLNTSYAFATISGVNLSGSTYNTCAFVDPEIDEIIVIALTASPSAWRINAAGTVTSITSSIITGGYLASLNATAGIKSVVFDQIAEIGSAPEIYLYVSSTKTAAAPTSVMRYNGVSALLGDSSGQPNYSGGGSIFSHSTPNINVSSNCNWLPRPDDDGITAGVPTVEVMDVVGPLINRVRLSFRPNKAWQARLGQISGGPSTFDLSTAPIGVSPIKPGSVAISATISGVSYYAEDNSSGVFPASTLLPTGGTIDYDTSIVDGITATIDDGSVIRALFVGGSGTLQVYKSLSSNEYPASQSGQLATLTAASDGSASGTVMFNFTADGSTHTVDVNMDGFLNGDTISISPYIY